MPPGPRHQVAPREAAGRLHLSPQPPSLPNESRHRAAVGLSNTVTSLQSLLLTRYGCPRREGGGWAGGQALTSLPRPPGLPSPPPTRGLDSWGPRTASPTGAQGRRRHVWAPWGHPTSKIILHTNSHFPRKRAHRSDPSHFLQKGLCCRFFSHPESLFWAVGIPAYTSRGSAQSHHPSVGQGGTWVGWEEAAPSIPVPATPGPTDLIVSGVLQININNPVTEGIWENLIKMTPCKLAASPKNRSQ